MTRLGLALLVVAALPAAALAQPGAPPPAPPGADSGPAPLPRLSVTAAVGYLSTSTSAGRERTTALGLGADWRPLADPLWGLRLQYGYGAIEDGTSLAHSKRASHLIAAHATRHWRATGSLYLFGGLGLGGAVVRTVHEVDDDEHVGVALKPGWTWTAGVDLPFHRLLFRLDATGIWHQVSHDQIYALRLGARF